jgi:polysaccharide biosynthesis transport protein
MDFTMAVKSVSSCMLKSLTSDVPFSHATTLQQLRPIDFFWISRILLRNGLFIATCTAAFFLVALVYCLSTRPLYSSTVSILVGPRQPIVLTAQQSAGSEQIEAAYVDSQVEILKSAAVLDRVVKARNLVGDPELSQPESVFSVAGVMSFLSPFISAASQEDAADKSTAYNNLRRNLAIKRVGLTYVLEASVTTHSPTKSADFANSIANAFLQDNLDARSLVAEEASQWLQGRASALQALAVAADTRVQRFKSDHNIVTGGKGLVTDQEISEISSQLTIARGQLSENQAKLESVTAALTNGNSDGASLESLSVADSLANSITVKLRSAYIENNLRITQLAKANGENHSSVQKLKAENAALKQNIRAELQRVADSYGNDLEMTKARIVSIEGNMQKAVDTSNVAGSAQVQLNDLEREAESYRTIYQMSLGKLQESTQQQSFPVNEFRVITAAIPNTQKSWPKSFLTLTLATMAGLAFGSLLALARASTDKTLHTPLDVRQQIGERCLAVIPQLGARQLRFASMMDMSQQAIAHPLRDIRLAVCNAVTPDAGLVVGIISTIRGEGRSTVALGLASSYVSAGFKTLLIDADFDNPRISQDLAAADEGGFLGALNTNVHATINVLVEEKSGLHILPAGKPSTQAQRVAALTSNAVAKTITELRRDYDITIIDFAPLRESNDALTFTSQIDGFLYITEAGATPSPDILLALEDAEQVYLRIKGFVLTKVKKRRVGWPNTKKLASSLPRRSPLIETSLSR